MNQQRLYRAFRAGRWITRQQADLLSKYYVRELDLAVIRASQEQLHEASRIAHAAIYRARVKA